MTNEEKAADEARKRTVLQILTFLRDDPTNALDWDDSMRSAAKEFAHVIEGMKWTGEDAEPIWSAALHYIREDSQREGYLDGLKRAEEIMGRHLSDNSKALEELRREIAEHSKPPSPPSSPPEPIS